MRAPGVLGEELQVALCKHDPTHHLPISAAPVSSHAGSDACPLCVKHKVLYTGATTTLPHHPHTSPHLPDDPQGAHAAVLLPLPAPQTGY